MHPQKKRRIAWQCSPSQNDILLGSNISTQNTTHGQKWQDAYVARRYRVKPSIARLICDWQRYGGAHG